MADVNALRKLVEASDTNSLRVEPEDTLLEVFCVDTSISMARSQTFPYIFGESKLSLCKRIVLKGFALPEHCDLYTALVKFNAGPSLAIPFALHNSEQSDLIKASLSQTEHQKGSAIYSSYAFCEKIVSEFQQEHGLQGCKVLIHLFTDGIDNGSAEEDVAKYQNVIENQSTVGLRQSFLYSFDTAFEQSSALAKSLQAHLVTIHESEINTALEERDRWVLKFLASKPKISKAHKGFNLAKGYTPDLANVYHLLQKAYRFFSSGKYVTKEGLFRVNANVNESRRLATQLLSNTENLSDFEDSILVAHALKTALSNSPPILPATFQQAMIDISQQPKESLLDLARAKIMELPQLNRDCLHILLFLLKIVAKEANVNKMTSVNLSVIFTYLLFPELLVPNPGLQDLLVLLIEECHQIFPNPPLSKVSFVAPGSTKNAQQMPEPSNVAHAPSDPIDDFEISEAPGLPSAPASSHSISHAKKAPALPFDPEALPPRVRRVQSIQPEMHEYLKERSVSDSHAEDAYRNTHHGTGSTDPETDDVPKVRTFSESHHRPLPPHLRPSEDHAPSNLIHAASVPCHGYMRVDHEGDATGHVPQIVHNPPLHPVPPPSHLPPPHPVHATDDYHGQNNEPHHAIASLAPQSTVSAPLHRRSAPPQVAPPAAPTVIVSPRQSVQLNEEAASKPPMSPPPPTPSDAH